MNFNMPLERYVGAAFKAAAKEGAKEVKSIALIHRTWSKDHVLDHAAGIALAKYLEMAQRSGLPPMFESVKLLFKQKLKEAIEQEIM
jgi:hypothetical protein